MAKKEWEIWEIIMETVTAVALAAYFGLQAYYGYVYESGAAVMFYHILPPALLYACMALLQRFPEFLNGGGEPLKGKVRIYAVRMVRTCKMILMFGVLLPSAADALGIGMNAAFSLFVMAAVLGTVGYYLYRIFQYNSKKKQ